MNVEASCPNCQKIIGLAFKEAENNKQWLTDLLKGEAEVHGGYFFEAASLCDSCKNLVLGTLTVTAHESNV